MNKKNAQDQFNFVADLIESNVQAIVSILCEIETQKTAENEVEKTIRAIRTYGDEDRYIVGRKPEGTVAVFLPFNMPLYSLVLYSFGALYVGNRVLVRPSKMTYKQVYKIWNIILPAISRLEIELIECGGGEFLDRSLNKELVNVVIFTGQWESVCDIEKKIPSHVKLIYCGSGMCPLIIKRDADLNLAVDIAVFSKLFNSGQDCLSTEKIYVDSAVLDRFTELLLIRLKSVVVSSNASDITDVGPLVSDALVTRAKEIISSTKGKIVLKGPVLESERMISPTVILTSIDDEAFITEKFAPIFTIASYSNDREMIKDVNESKYCLGVTVVGSEYDEKTFRAAHVEYNKSVLAFEEEDAHVPFGGFGKSGFVLRNGIKNEGPILFSIETSKQKGDCYEEKNVH